MDNITSDLEPFHSMQDYVIQNLMKDFVNKQNEVIKVALLKNGIDPNNIEFLKENIQKIIIEGDPYEHYYYRHGQPDEIRIISIEKNPTYEQDFNTDIHSYKINYTQKYY